MPTFETYSAWIELEGQRVPEWGTVQQANPDGSTTISCWVPSSAGKEFLIGYSEAEGKTASDVQFEVDGVALSCEVLHADKSHNRTSSGLKGVTAWRGVHPFQFERCQIIDGQSAFAAGKPGEIVVSFADCWVSGMSTSMATPDKNVSLLFDSRFARQPRQRFHHGLAHYTQVGMTLIEPLQEKVDVHSFDGEPRVRFVFHYRPLDVLIEGRAPRPAQGPRLVQNDSDSE